MRINTQIIKELKPCTDRYENWLFNYIGFDGTLEEFFGLTEITHRDKLWVSLRLMDRTSVEAFSLDCAVSAKNYAAAYVASDAAYAAYAAAAADAADAAYAAYAADAAYAAYVASDAAYAAYAAYAAERANQLEAILWLVDKFEKGE